MTEFEFLEHARGLAARNRVFKSCIGLGYYDCITPSVILRNVLENPGWYTPYTPYQAEIAQGRLEGLLNFQTMVTDLTGMEVANASLLDEATAAAEAMTMMHRLQPKTGRDRDGFLVSDSCFPQTLEVAAHPGGAARHRAGGGADAEDWPSTEVFGVLVQTRTPGGAAGPPASSLRAATMRRMCWWRWPPTCWPDPGDARRGRWARTSCSAARSGSGCRWATAGPHAAFFATREAFVREVPGRIIGVSVDAHGQPAYRMALQTREQHIRREKAKSNICTAQALLANMAGFYAVYHGPRGIRAIAERIHGLALPARPRADPARAAPGGCRAFFDTLRVRTWRRHGPARTGRARARAG